MVIVRRGTQYVLYSKDRSKVLGKFRSKKKALERERQIQFFKHMKGMTAINPITRFHRKHHHKICGAMAAAGIGLIIFPEPVISDAVGITMIGLAMLFAFLNDHFMHRVQPDSKRA